jgi:hypothetical protein
MIQHRLLPTATGALIIADKGDNRLSFFLLQFLPLQLLPKQKQRKAKEEKQRKAIEEILLMKI